MARFNGRTYQARFDALAEQGLDVHGEANLVRSLSPASVLDAGCGTGRVAIELARHGIEVVGVDIDESMIAEARRRAPELEWIRSDLSTLALNRKFDVVVLAGNVPLFCNPKARTALVHACASHVDANGAMIAGFQLDRDYHIEEYDRACESAGLSLESRWSTWDGQPGQIEDLYTVTVYRRPG